MLVLAGSFKAQIGLILLVGALGYVKYTVLQTRCVGMKLYGQLPAGEGCQTFQEPMALHKRSSFWVDTARLIRRGTLLGAGVLGVSGGVIAATTDTIGQAAPSGTTQTVDLGPPPLDYGLMENNFYTDAEKVVRHMRYASQLEKGSPYLEEVGQRTKQEIVDFVSFYRRFRGVQGKPSFSLLYTSINVLAGHYTSYGYKVAVPEKRRKRLLQELADIDRNLQRGR